MQINAVVVVARLNSFNLYQVSKSKAIGRRAAIIICTQLATIVNKVVSILHYE